MLLRPTTTAIFPEISVPVLLMSSMQPIGVQGTNMGVPSFWARAPALIVWMLGIEGAHVKRAITESTWDVALPVNILPVVDGVRDDLFVQVGRQRQLDKDAVNAGVVVQALNFRDKLNDQMSSVQGNIDSPGFLPTLASVTSAGSFMNEVLIPHCGRRNTCWQPSEQLKRQISHLLGSLQLHADIERRVLAVADLDDGQVGGKAGVRGLDSRDLGPEPLADSAARKQLRKSGRAGGGRQPTRRLPGRR